MSGHTTSTIFLTTSVTIVVIAVAMARVIAARSGPLPESGAGLAAMRLVTLFCSRGRWIRLRITAQISLLGAMLAPLLGAQLAPAGTRPRQLLPMATIGKNISLPSLPLQKLSVQPETCRSQCGGGQTHFGV